VSTIARAGISRDVRSALSDAPREPRDIAQARYWFDLAAAQGNQAAQQNLAKHNAQ
jgi:TPR repeat protein